MSEELKPVKLLDCPFCGGEAELIEVYCYTSNTDEIRVECADCCVGFHDLVRNKERYEGIKKELILTWQTRQTPKENRS